MELEGLRGVAAIAVVLYHCLQAFYPFAIYGALYKTQPLQHMRFEDNYYGTPLAALTNGVFAVAIFFVLSGFVLSIGFFQTKRVELVRRMAMNRYVRLMLPALASVLICWVVIKLGLASRIQAADINSSHWLYERWEGFDLGLLSALQQGLIGIFTNFSNSDKLFNPVLWTMTTEFVGSFIVFAFLLLFAGSKYRWLAYGALFVALFNSWIVGFIAGMLLADLYSSGVIRRARRKYLAFGLPLLGLVFGAYPRGEVHGTLYQYLTIPGIDIHFQMLYTLLGAAVLVFSVIYIKQLADVFAGKWLSRLGKYTFSLYLVHIPVILTLMTGLFIFLNSHMGYNRAVALSFLLTAPVVIGATILFERYVDAPSIRFAKYLTKVYEGKEELQLRQRLAAAKENAYYRVAIARGRLAATFRSPEEPSE